MKHLIRPFLWLVIALFAMPTLSGCFFYGFGHHHHHHDDDGWGGRHHDHDRWHDRW